MRSEDMDVYPILHKERVYNVITELDLTFVEVHGMLDWLNANGAFDRTDDDDFMGPGKLYSFVLDGVSFDVDVQGYEVVVYRREG